VKWLLEQHPRRVVLDAVRSSVEAARAGGESQHTEEQWVEMIASAVRESTRPSLRRVINATGVVLHTNLGRAPLADAAISAIAHVAEGFSNLEYDVETGQRGSRYSHCVGLLDSYPPRTRSSSTLRGGLILLNLNALTRAEEEVLVSREARRQRRLPFGH
jgi:L-seryl-tRNA(Ser) seleniumtransferase